MSEKISARGGKGAVRAAANGSASTAEVTSKEVGACNKENSLAVAFGRNFFFALGGTDTLEPASVDTGTIMARKWDKPSWKDEANADDSSDIKLVVCTVQSTVFLTEQGKIYQTGTLHGRVMPQAIPITIPLPLKCVQIAAGRHFCLGMMEGGLAVVSWGAGHFGQLGLGGNKKTEDTNLTFAPYPIVIERLLPHVIGSPIKQVACGDWHGLAVTQSGRVWAWGSNRSHQCGRKAATKPGNQAPPTIVAPLPVPIEVPVSKIAAGRAHSVAISSETAQVYCWGASSYGQCGHVMRRSGIAPPRLVDGLGDLTITDIAAGSTHTLALTSGGRVFSWGSGSEGQLGLGASVSAQPRPKLVSDLDFVAIEAGQEWKNTQKQTPSGSSKKNTPKTALSSVPRIASVYCGGSYSAVISSSGHVYTFGSNDVGQAGLPTPSHVPLKDNYVQAPPRTSSIRDLHVSTFDSRHNVLLPVRIDTANHLFVNKVACGPNHMWCIGRERTAQENTLTVGRTLYEVQEEKRSRNLQRAKDYLLQKVPQISVDETSTSDAESSLAETAAPVLTPTATKDPPDEPKTSASVQESPGSRKPKPTLAVVTESKALSSSGNVGSDAAISSPMQLSTPSVASPVASSNAQSPAKQKRRFSLSNLLRRKKKGAGGKADNNARSLRKSKRNSL